MQLLPTPSLPAESHPVENTRNGANRYGPHLDTSQDEQHLWFVFSIREVLLSKQREKIERDRPLPSHNKSSITIPYRQLLLQSH